MNVLHLLLLHFEEVNSTEFFFESPGDGRDGKGNHVVPSCFRERFCQIGVFVSGCVEVV